VNYGEKEITMSSLKILTVSLLPLVVAACTAPQKSIPTASTTTQKTSTAGAVRVAGDLVPGQLAPFKVPVPTESALLQGSDALAPQKPFEVATPPEPVVGRDVHRTMQGADPSAFLLPVDAPVGARVIVRPVDPNVNLTTVHLIDVATGAQLDLARDEGTMRPNVTHTPVQAGPAGVPLDGRQAAPPQAGGPIDREPGFEPVALRSRVLSIDMPFKPGMVRVQVPAGIAASGIIVELQEPNARVTFSGVSDELAHGLGDTATITCGVLSDKTGVDGATVTGWVELPGHVHGPNITFSPSGGGQYVAKLPLNSPDQATIGMWGLHLTATGSANGVPFEREIESGFGFFPSHAQMTAFGSPVVARGADGLVDSVSFDVDVHTLVTDRFSVRGTLTYTDAQGAEHPLAAAQTGQVLAVGDGTITLRFDAAAMALAKVNGPFNLRDVALVSQGTGTTQHRLGRGLEIVTAPIASNEIRFPRTIPLASLDLIRNGDLPQP
jgi:hypothetical protein